MSSSRGIARRYHSAASATALAVAASSLGSLIRRTLLPMTPVVGTDPIAALEREIENEKREIAAREARLDRLRASVSGREALRSVS